jgi:hypothetical protein
LRSPSALVVCLRSATARGTRESAFSLAEALIGISLLTVIALILATALTNGQRHAAQALAASTGGAPANALLAELTTRARDAARTPPPDVSLARLQTAWVGPIGAGPLTFELAPQSRYSLAPACNASTPGCQQIRLAMIRCQTTSAVVDVPGQLAYRACFFAHRNSYAYGFSASVGGALATSDIAFAEVTATYKSFPGFQTLPDAATYLATPAAGVAVALTLHWTRAGAAYRQSLLRYLER